MHGLAVSDDGQLVAAPVREGNAAVHLEVVRRGDARILGRGFDTNTNMSEATALEWTPQGDLVVAGWAHNDAVGRNMPVIGVVPAGRINSNQPYDAAWRENIMIALPDDGASSIRWVALSHNGSEIAFAEEAGNIWVADFEEAATPHQITTEYIGGWTVQFSPDGTQLALANRNREQFIIPNHRGQPINLLLDRDKYLVGNTLVNHIDAWLP